MFWLSARITKAFCQGHVEITMQAYQRVTFKGEVEDHVALFPASHQQVLVVVEPNFVPEGLKTHLVPTPATWKPCPPS